jgi:pyruvate,water dikinase
MSISKAMSMPAYRGYFLRPDEENPMLGFRCASRYTHPGYVDGFTLECAA